jgi:hypothetical protein
MMDDSVGDAVENVIENAATKAVDSAGRSVVGGTAPEAPGEQPVGGAAANASAKPEAASTPDGDRLECVLGDSSGIVAEPDRRDAPSRDARTHAAEVLGVPFNAIDLPAQATSVESPANCVRPKDEHDHPAPGKGGSHAHPNEPDACGHAPSVSASPTVTSTASSTVGPATTPSAHAPSEIDTDRPSAKRVKTESGNPEPNSSRIDFTIPTLRHFSTYTRVQHTLEGYVVRALAENRRLDHVLIHGRPGSGTTVLARALVRDYAPSRVEELDALGGLPSAKLRRALIKANRRGVVLIRHIELLDNECAHMVINYMAGKPMLRAEGEGGSMRMPWESERDREIAESARPQRGESSPPPPMQPGGTIIGTALIPARLPYALRSRFEQMVHLRSDPKALRAAMARVLRPHGITLAENCFRRAERVLGALTDGTEPLSRAVLARALLEGVTIVDDDLLQSIVEEDLPSRLPDTLYAAALRDHLGGRKVKCASDDEVARIAQETGWGTIAAQSAISTMLRENRARKRAEPGGL